MSRRLKTPIRFIANCIGATMAVFLVVFIVMFEGVGKRDSVIDYSGKVYELETINKEVK